MREMQAEFAQKIGALVKEKEDLERQLVKVASESMSYHFITLSNISTGETSNKFTFELCILTYKKDNSLTISLTAYPILSYPGKIYSLHLYQWP